VYCSGTLCFSPRNVCYMIVQRYGSFVNESWQMEDEYEHGGMGLHISGGGIRVINNGTRPDKILGSQNEQ